MALQSGNILIVKSDTMADRPSGGGNITSQIVVGGESNNIFNDVSPLDRTTGALHLRKVFASVSIQSNDIYFGAHSIISKIPADSQVNVALFNTNDWHDRRSEASDRIAGYFAKGTDYPGFLYGTAWAGSKTINIFQSPEADEPLIGDVMILTQGSEEQYIRVTEIESEERSFTVNDTTFIRNIVTISITDALRFDFVGASITDQDNISPPTLISTTIVANSAKYYSARPIETQINTGASQIKADTLFTQLVPNTLVETAKVNQDPSGNVVSNYSASDNQFTYTTSTYFTSGTVFTLGGSVLSGSLSIVTTLGTITDSAGSVLHNGTIIGSINYNTGVITFSNAASQFYDTKTITFNPAAPITTVTGSAYTSITVANRGAVFTKSINQSIGKGSASVSFLSIGNWYTMYDNGDGALTSVNGVGTGTIDYDNGIFSINLSELPDAESDIIWMWGRPTAVQTVSTKAISTITETAFSNLVSDGFSSIFQIENSDGLDLSSFTITWSGGSVTTSATGEFSGDATGSISRMGIYDHVVNIKFNNLPAKGTLLSFAYNTDEAVSASVNYPNNKSPDGTITFTIPGAPIKPGSVAISWAVNSFFYQDAETKKFSEGKNYQMGIRDNGTGGFLSIFREPLPGFLIDYTSGVVSIDPKVKLPVDVFESVNGVAEWSTITVDGYPDEGDTDIEIRATTLNSDSSGVGTYPVESIQFIGNGDGRTMDIVSGSVSFTMNNTHWYSSGYSIKNSAGTTVGTVNKENSIVTLTTWMANLVNNDITLDSMLNIASPVLPASSSQGIDSSYTAVSEFAFRIEGAPIKSQSFEMTLPYVGITTTSSTISYSNNYFGTLGPDSIISRDITRTEEELYVTSDANGVLSGTNSGTGTATIIGSIDIETGVVKFSLEDSSGDPVFFDPSNIRYTASTKRFIPIDSEILGIDHVRLPENGRVPAFAVGDIVVVHNTRSVELSPTQGTDTDLGQTLLSKVSATDASGTILQSTQYTVDLELGVVSWVNLTGVIMPITVAYTIEDLSTLSDVQIDGTLDLTTPVVHDYPLTDTIVSNALIHGDMFANVSNPFDQQVWSGTWSDTLIGSATLGEFNNTQYPIVVNNQDCIEEEWLLQFVTSTLVNVIGRHTGQVLSAAPISNVNSTIAPINPATGWPYFTISNAAFGGGWSAGNVIRFNTYAANAPVWIIQSVNQGAAESTEENALGFCLEVRGARNTVV